MRQDKTLKIVANFISKFQLKIVQESPMCDLKEHLGSDKSFFFIANDYSEEAAVIEKFVFKFGNSERIFSFKKQMRRISKKLLMTVRNSIWLSKLEVKNSNMRQLFKKKPRKKRKRSKKRKSRKPRRLKRKSLINN
jgi:hypothetical protein